MKKTILIAIILVSIFLVACTSGGTSKTTASGFIGGKEGLSTTLTIDSTSGGNKIFDNGVDPFKINVNLQNKGEHEVKESEVLITLDGVNFNAFQIRDPSQRSILPLSGLRKEAGKVTAPAQTIVEFDANYKPNEENLSEDGLLETYTIYAN